MERCKGGSNATAHLSQRRRLSNHLDTRDNGAGYCADDHTGPECLLCRATASESGKSLYLDQGTGGCMECPELGERVGILAAVAIPPIVLLLLIVLAVFHPIGNRLAPIRTLRFIIAVFVSYARSVGITSKVRIGFSL